MLSHVRTRSLTAHRTHNDGRFRTVSTIFRAPKVEFRGCGFIQSKPPRFFLRYMTPPASAEAVSKIVGFIPSESWNQSQWIMCVSVEHAYVHLHTDWYVLRSCRVNLLTRQRQFLGFIDQASNVTAPEKEAVLCDALRKTPGHCVSSLYPHTGGGCSSRLDVQVYCVICAW